MNQSTKTKLLEAARRHILAVCERISAGAGQCRRQSDRLLKEALRLPADDAYTNRRVALGFREQADHLDQLQSSPYFAKCEFETKGEKRIMYFGKFSFSDEHIYSWITPAATLRFENPGPTSYRRPDGESESGTLQSKDQYMIVDNQLLFYATESIDHPRELVYQEHFTRHKEGFVLPEVVEQMEKAQDQVVRAHFKGSFVIAGPAGSGKTTLALHRVAYLVQSPETAEYFKPETILVLVQDDGTKEYFSHLLPELGIQGVRIVTFSQWALEVLGLTGYSYTRGFGTSRNERYFYEHAKRLSLNVPTQQPYTRNVFSVLAATYEQLFTDDHKRMLAQQKQETSLDRFDLTVLLNAYRKTHGAFAIEKDVYQERGNGTYRKTRRTSPLQYNLLIIDEFQNYLPQQLQILKTCVNENFESLVYVGDMAQQTQLGTIRNWSEIHETISADRLVTLQKVYRNTKQILEYIRSLGYPIQIPKELKEGTEVMERHVQSSQDATAFIRNHLPSDPQMTIGVLAREKRDLDEVGSVFCDRKNVYCLSFHEAQGVEFDVVFIFQEHDHEDVIGVSNDFIQEVKTVERDLLYVALTRAMSELYILIR